MAGGGSSSSKPVDMTPQAFKAMQAPFASVFASLLGFGAPGGPSNGTGWGPQPAGNGQQWVYAPNAQGGGGTWSLGSNSGQQFGGTGGTQGSPQKYILQQRRSGGQNSSETWHDIVPLMDGTMGGGNGNGGGSPFSFPVSGNPNDILNGIPQYGGPLVAGIGQNEQALLDLLMGAQGGGSGGMTAGPNGEALDYLSKVMGGDFMPGGATPGGMSAFTQMLQGSRQTQGYQGTAEEINPFLNAAITSAQRPTLQGLEETLTRALPGRFTEAGQFKQPGGSSAFDRAAGVATRGAADAMADIATNLSYATYEAERGRTFEAQEGARSREDAAMSSELDRLFQGREGERNRQNEAAGLTSTIQAQEVDNLVKNLQAQALPRLIQEFGIERGLEQFNNRMNSLLATLGIAQGVTAPVIGQKSESKTKPNLMPLLG